MNSYIVIGAGIVGASTAYHLAKKGLEVTIIDRKDRGQATGASAGIICPWVSQRRNKDWYTLAKNGAKFYQKLMSELSKDGIKETGYKQVGTLNIHNDESKLDNLEERLYKRLEKAPEIGEIRRLSAFETKKLFPFIEKSYSSIFVSGGARIDGKALRDALIKVAKKNGAKFIRGEATLLSVGNNVIEVFVNDKKISSNKIIVTTGAWGKELFQRLGIQFIIRPQKAQIVHLQTKFEGTGEWPVVMAPTNKYILPFSNGKIVVGTTSEDEAIFDDKVTAGAIQEILSDTFRIAPDLDSSEFIEAKVGFRPVAEGFHPIIGSVPSMNNVFVANGLGASGLTVGPYIGEQLANLVIGEEVEINLAKHSVENAIRID